MGFSEFRNYLEARVRFYKAMPGQWRHDNEWEWSTTGEKRYSARSVLLRSRFVDLARSVLGRDKERILIREHMEDIYWVRSRFSDEMSRHLFDEAIILRLVGHHRFFQPRWDFTELLSLISKTEFLDPTLPHHFLGIPISLFTVSLSDELNAASDSPVVLIGHNHLIQLVNQWRQYFLIREGFRVIPAEGEVVFDCGACLGEMSILFGAMVGSKGSVHTFDPVPLHNSFLALQKSLNPWLKDTLNFNQMAVGDKTEAVNRGKINDPDDISPGGLVLNQYQVTSLDDYVAREQLNRVDFIKMDIEGFEIPALEGAREIIKRHRPKLAISIYHRSADFWEIPKLIDRLNPDYRFAFGHHSPTLEESVLYAY